MSVLFVGKKTEYALAAIRTGAVLPAVFTTEEEAERYKLRRPDPSNWKLVSRDITYGEWFDKKSSFNPKEFLTYDDFYDIAEYANENWKGNFTKKEIAVYAYRYLSDFLFSFEHGNLVPTIETLCKGLKEDLDSGYDANVDHWLTQIERTGLWCRNYEKK